jgi:hypothetical protein
MRLTVTLAILIAATVPAMAQVQPSCGVGQACSPGSNQVPFPVVNPMQGLANVLSLPRNNNQPPPPTSANGLAPIATPPPVLPPGVNR